MVVGIRPIGLSLDLTPPETVDLLGLLLAEPLGEGIARRVFRVRDWRSVGNVVGNNGVIKLDRGSQYDFQNIAEWSLWQAAIGTKLESWLCPCIDISPSGSWLLQEYAEPITQDRIPVKAPSILVDQHPGNWGWYEGRPVAIDYGRHVAADIIARGMKLMDVDRADD